MKKKLLIIAGAFVILTAVAIVGVRAIYLDNQWLFDQFRSFSVRIDNQSDHDFTIVEAGILQSDSEGKVVEGESKSTVGKTLASGARLTVTPKLSIAGEGGIYLKMTDAEGETATHVVCSYTESLSGKTLVIVTNDDVEIEQNCH
jgi:uncharacterized protein affecting Mg2+/Co2+ transport